MKKLLLIALTFTSLLTFADTCDEFAAKAIKCYEKGHLDRSYDEIGENCGVADDSLWTVAGSINSTIKTRVENIETETYSGGSAENTECYVTFENAQAESCSFEMMVSLGTEDGSVDIKEFICK